MSQHQQPISNRYEFMKEGWIRDFLAKIMFEWFLFSTPHQMIPPA